ncbi:chemotaxis protein [Janthinobacterium sp. 17J80-10]|uniref:chemotaxis protein n=1 Tax=Janthinobacterium sp. 17J80-10 TaxID=2497863 RepID=UPI0010052A34|nr:chemotaxis protein [Janthinobacterium sp. 17J80-10]QAU34319.1 chemotaxis protein [Janthinobacterium sp. 17J80-10]
MTRKKLLAPQVKGLLEVVADHGNQNLTEVETDLLQTTFLLGEAIEKLSSSFMAIHETVRAQQDLVDALLSNGVPPSGSAEKLKDLQGEIGRHVNAAVTGLQFQDMTTQLIGRTVRRVTGLREVLDVLEGGSAAILADASAENIAEVLHNLNAVVESQAKKLESLLWKPVHQTHMESGDIELF